ncbi:WbqC family protein [Danxiaibacter flavus]|uniref:WbqC family protein n=1 Tax=Danxiaibacter flavus TaxID=3049108 RepID=A0ABV3ZC47_9BACT|nr:WbqC family protein [Chitinophagaceae bacterium DXS]
MTGNNQLLIDLQYFPCINYFKVLSDSTYCKINLSEPYKKMSFRNRCVIVGSNGLINLSVPVEKGRNQRIPYAEVKIAYQENWQVQHWRTIVSCYNRSPYFEYYANKLEPLFLSRWEHLVELNQRALKIVTGILKVNMPEFIDNVHVENLVDYRDKWLPKDYDQDGESVKYVQLFEDRIGFKTNLSILDLLFMEGPNAAALLKRRISPK